MNGSDDTIAVIIPVYRGVKTIGSAIESVLNQTYRNLELWLVDDGSPDESGSILDEYATKDSRIRVIHQKNTGCYHARLAALQAITTPYFAFVDQDDVAEPNLLEELLKFSKAHNLDIAQCDIDGAKKIGDSEELYLSKEEVLRGYLYDTLIAGGDQVTMWGKLYRNIYDFKEFLAVGKVTSFEDMIYNLQMFSKVERFGIVHKGLYHYIINEGSSVRNFSKSRLADFEEGYRMRKLWLPRYGIGDAVAELLNAKWVVKNLRNALISAANAPTSSEECRFDNITAILKAAGLEESLQTIYRHKCKRARGVMLLELARRMPVKVTVAIIQVLFRLRQIVKGLM